MIKRSLLRILNSRPGGRSFGGQSSFFGLIASVKLVAWQEQIQIFSRGLYLFHFIHLSLGCACGMRKFLGQGLNPCHGSNNAESLTTRPPGNSRRTVFQNLPEIIPTGKFPGNMNSHTHTPVHTTTTKSGSKLYRSNNDFDSQRADHWNSFI